ncbi:hypothetical protein GGI25_005198 [Coemansia spiralis]|uniref:Origin recognition complex subunit 6 n=2 Tax=Coemansia TaxID=4863 RepID=A0A9W8KWC7_9FUNG|nr:hypothetical protein BX070DRAFT_225602 [Coemansia spiralis]KAJ1992279.1 hypothetical protein EDC05_002947 [Coemansia umbellata]KAJ2623393.1 hypothetical protein GGI26_002431 [Coemansia sp. RSA 1358]KAJ2672271.1 hypothetical protein GGI25_005198 [Coemansia spiralis]
MAHMLSEQLEKLQLSNTPGVAPKAAQFFDQICKRMPTQRNNVLSLSRQLIAIQLACENLSVEFNELAANAMSAVSQRAYQSCVQSVRIALGLNKHLTFEQLDVQFNPPPIIIEYSRRLLDEFKQAFIATLPTAVGRNIDLDNSAYIAAAFYLVTTRFKKRIAGKQKLIAVAMIKQPVFLSAMEKVEQFGKNTLAEIDSRGTDLTVTPSRKRTRNMDSVNNGNDEGDDTCTARTSGSRLMNTPTTVQVDEVGSVVNKRVKHFADARAVSEPRPSGSSSLRVEMMKRQRATPSNSTTPPILHETPTKRRSTRSSIIVEITAKEENKPQSKSTATRTPKRSTSNGRTLKKAAAAAKRPRIGVASMIQDRDYKDLPLYADYQEWKTKMLKAL